jgi:RecA/RadA recombinase
MAKAKKQTGDGSESLKDKLMSLTKIQDAAFLDESDVFGVTETIPTNIPIMDIALSGDLDGGMLSWGMLQIAGPSKNFKTLYGLILCKSFLEANPDGYILFYDNEGGAGPSYFKAVGIPTDRVIHIPFNTIEMVKNDIAYKFEGDMDAKTGKFKGNGLQKGDKVMIFVDSIGNAASRKEAEDSATDKGTKDMTRAASLKSFGRVITPHLMSKQVPMVIVNHVYDKLDGSGGLVVGGGSGLYLSSQDIWVVRRKMIWDKQEQKFSETEFTIFIEKSRRVRERSTFTLVVDETGLQRYSGLFDIAVEAGLITQKGAWYSIPGVEGKSFYRKEVEFDPDFWAEFLDNETFKEYIRTKYLLTHGEQKLVADRIKQEVTEPIEE